MNIHPKQADKIDISQVEDGYVIYQADEDRVHYLNQTAVLVLEICTGANTVEAIVQIVQDAFQLADSPEQDVRACLETMVKERLIA
jgi:hypothetical protein